MESEIRVIMITYNGDTFFQKQLESIVDQKHLESIHIYDDCSNDQFLEVLKKYQGSQQNIQVHLNDTNLGVIGNVKRALNDNTEAQYIALCDQDDIWIPNKLDRCFSAMKEMEESSSSTPLLVYHDMKVMDQNDLIGPETFWELRRQKDFQHSFESNLITNLVTGSASLINNTLASYAKDIPEDLNIYHDAWLGMVAYTMGKVKCLNEPMSIHRSHSDSLTFDNMKKESLWSRVNRNLKNVIGKEAIFGNQFIFIEQFLDCYENRINNYYLNKLKEFLFIKNKSYLHQKRFIANTLKNQR